MSKPSQDAEVMLNRANVALARSQKVIESWLGPSAVVKSTSGYTWDQTEEDESYFKPEPELLGIGAKAPDTNDIGLGPKRKAAGVNDKLLEQILGKNGAKQHRAKVAAKKPAAEHSATPPPKGNGPTTQPRPAEDDSDGSEGRAAMIKSKSGRKRGRLTESDEAVHESTTQDGTDDEAHRGGKSGPGSLKRKGTASSYLDQILAEKGSKKKAKRTT